MTTGLAVFDRDFLRGNFLPEVAEQLQPGAFLDIGCHRGVHLQTFSERGWDCVGVDIDAEALKTAEKYGRVHLRHGEEPLSFLPDESFDVVNTFNLFHHVKDVEGNLKEALRCLKPGGYLLVSENVENAFLLRVGRNIFSKWEGMPVCSRMRVEEWLALLPQYPVNIQALFVRSQYREIPWVMVFFLSLVPIVGPWARRSFTDTFRKKRGEAKLRRHDGVHGGFNGVQKAVFVLQKQLEPADTTLSRKSSPAVARDASR
jgi:SAM-dependent methyltransferase